MQDHNPAPTVPANIALLPPPERAAIVLNANSTEEHLRKLVEASSTITAVIDPAGREEAHRAAMNLKNARCDITNAGKKARDDANAFCSAVIATEKKLIAIGEAEEKRVFGLRDAYDAKVKAEKEEKERIERERVAAIKAKIEGLRGLPGASLHDSAEQIGATLAELEAFEVAEGVFAEFAGEAAEAKAQAMDELRALHAKAVAAEEAAAQLEAERARQAAEATRLAEEAARLKAESDKLEAARREFEEHRAAAARAEQERIAAQAQPAADNTAAQAPAAQQMDLQIADAAPAEPVIVPTDTVTIITARADLTTSQDPAPARDDRGLVTCLNLVVADLLAIGFDADEIRELVEAALTPDAKEAA